MSTPIITNPVFSQGSLKEKIHYYTSCYLTLGKVTCNSIASSTTYNGRTYHLLNTDHLTPANSIFTWIGSTIKVISYCTIVIPVIALLLHKSTQTHGLYFAKESSYSYFSLKNCHHNNPEHLAILHRFVPDLFQTSLVKDACTNENIPFLKSVAEHSPNRLTETFTNFDSMPAVLQTILFDSQHESLHALLNPVYLTKMAQWGHNPDLEKLLNNNPSLWRSLVATKPPKDYCSPHKNNILISQVHAELMRCITENKDVLALHPDIFSIGSDSSDHRTTILALAFSHQNTKLFSYLLNQYKESVVTQQSLEGCMKWLMHGSNICCPLKDCNNPLEYSGKRTPSQDHMLSSLLPYTRAEIVNLFDDTTITNLQTSPHSVIPLIQKILQLINERDKEKTSCYPEMSGLFISNPSRWVHTIINNPLHEYCSPQYEKELFQQVYHTLWTSYITKKETPIQFPPYIFSLKQSDANNQTLFEVIFTRNELNFFSYLLKHYESHMLSDLNLKAFVNILQKKPTSASEYQTPYTLHSNFPHSSETAISFAQKEMFKKLLSAKKESLYDYFTIETMQNINSISERQDLIEYLNSPENPYPLPDNLRLVRPPQTPTTTHISLPSSKTPLQQPATPQPTPDSSTPPGRVTKTVKSTLNGYTVEMTSTTSSQQDAGFFSNLLNPSLHGATQPTESQLTIFIRNLQKILKKTTPNDPMANEAITRKSQLKQLYNEALRRTHSDKCTSETPDVQKNRTEITAKIISGYTAIKKNKEYQKLPD